MVPQLTELREEILKEFHCSRFSVHLDGTKMYQDLRCHYYWSGIKRHVGDFVRRCLTCQQVKAEHQKAAGLLQPLKVAEWKWEHVKMDFVTHLPRTQQKHDAVWVIVDRLTKLTHFLVVRMTFALERLCWLYIREIVRLHGVPLSIVSNRDPRFTTHFWKSFHKAMDTWPTRFIGPFEILERIGTVAYRLALPPCMSGVHEVFHVSMLQKYTPDPAHVVDWGQIEVDTDETFEEGPVCIVDSRDQVLRRKTVRLVRVLWRHHGVEESTWEREDTMRATYPFLFRDEGT